MKRKLMLVVAILALVSSASFAQLKYGGGLSLGTKAAIDESGEKMGIGINARVEYAFNEKWSIAPNFTYWFPSKVGEGEYEVKLNVWQLNADVHYSFAGDEALSFYGIGGLNLTGAKATVFGFSTSETNIGLNLGAGALLNERFFGEAKFDTEMEQLALTVGILF